MRCKILITDEDTGDVIIDHDATILFDHPNYAYAVTSVCTAYADHIAITIDKVRT